MGVNQWQTNIAQSLEILFHIYKCAKCLLGRPWRMHFPDLSDILQCAPNYEGRYRFPLSRRKAFPWPFYSILYSSEAYHYAGKLFDDLNFLDL